MRPDMGYTSQENDVSCTLESLHRFCECLYMTYMWLSMYGLWTALPVHCDLDNQYDINKQPPSIATACVVMVADLPALFLKNSPNTVVGYPEQFTRADTPSPKSTHAAPDPDLETSPMPVQLCSARQTLKLQESELRHVTRIEYPEIGSGVMLQEPMGAEPLTDTRPAPVEQSPVSAVTRFS